MVIDVVGFDWHCPQHITPRFTLEELERVGRSVSHAHRRHGGAVGRTTGSGPPVTARASYGTGRFPPQKSAYHSSKRAPAPKELVFPAGGTRLDILATIAYPLVR